MANAEYICARVLVENTFERLNSGNVSLVDANFHLYHTMPGYRHTHTHICIYKTRHYCLSCSVIETLITCRRMVGRLVPGVSTQFACCQQAICMFSNNFGNTWKTSNVVHPKANTNTIYITVATSFVQHTHTDTHILYMCTCCQQ